MAGPRRQADRGGLARTFAHWAAELTIDDVPDEVLDKVRSLVAHHLVGAVLAGGNPKSRALARLVCNDYPATQGARLIGYGGERVACSGAVLANSHILNAARLNDSFRMITHPGPVLLAVALANADARSLPAEDLIVALVSGYEFACRLANEFVPAVSAHGFRPAPIFATMGAALVGGKLHGLDESQLLATIGLAANLAGGLNESRRDAVTGGNENGIHQVNAARQGQFAAEMAATGQFRGSEKILEGEAGFFTAFTGNNTGRRSYAFSGPERVDLASIADGLGETYHMLDVMQRVYPVGGFNQPVIELMRELKEQHQFGSNDIVEAAIEVNYLETLYPSPRFPRNPDPSDARIGSIQYFLAYVAVHGDYPLIGSGEEPIRDDPVVASFMRDRVRLVGVHDHPMFSPRITLRMTSGVALSGVFPYRRYRWSFEETSRRLLAGVATAPGGRDQVQRILNVASALDELTSWDPIFEAVRWSESDDLENTTREGHGP